LNYGKEPLAPVVREDDEHWAELVNGVLWSIMEAEQQDITSDEIHSSSFGRKDGSDIWPYMVPENPDWPRDVVKVMGNYGEVWYHNFGTASRGLNNIWNADIDPGLIYSPAFR
jgi:general L-amino acid transport system substrate-binding protein